MWEIVRAIFVSSCVQLYYILLVGHSVWKTDPLWKRKQLKSQSVTLFAHCVRVSILNEGLSASHKTLSIFIILVIATKLMWLVNNEQFHWNFRFAELGQVGWCARFSRSLNIQKLQKGSKTSAKFYDVLNFMHWWFQNFFPVPILILDAQVESEITGCGFSVTKFMYATVTTTLCAAEWIAIPISNQTIYATEVGPRRFARVFFLVKDLSRLKISINSLAVTVCFSLVRHFSWVCERDEVALDMPGWKNKPYVVYRGSNSFSGLAVLLEWSSGCSKMWKPAWCKCWL